MIIRRMVSNAGNRWAVAGSTLLVWGLVAASAVYWGVKLSSGGRSVPVAPAARSAPPADPAAVARLLGSSPVAAPVVSAASRYQLLGVVAEPDGGGAALLAVDGKPPKPYRAGAQVDETLVLRSIEPRRVTLAASMQAPASVTLELPVRR